MRQFIDEFTSGLSTQFYIHQVIVILILMCYGLLLLYTLRKGKITFTDILLSFPCSLAVYSVSGYFLLSFGIPFTRISVPAVMLIVLLICLLSGRLSMQGENTDKGLDINKRNLLILSVSVIILALICVSGLFSISVENDSMYFFSEYPRALIHYGKLVTYLDNFLTDASQGVAILGTIPFFYGFDEIFGIMAFLNVNFIILFVYEAYSIAREKLESKTASLVAGLAFIMLVSSMPFVIMSRWFMANTFFMEFMFIVVFLAYKYSGTVNYADLTILSIFITGLSIMRMEGALNAGFLVLCIMMLEYRNKDIALYMVCPMLVLQSAYLYRIFRILELHTGYQFMTEQKAAILIAFLVVVFVYALVVRNRIFVKIQKFYKWILPAGFLALNILVLLYDRGDYITNMKAFVGNVTGNSGWGLFAALVIGVLILVPKKSMRVNYFDITTVCFVMLTIVVGWARGDTLCVSFGDSGNRILIQVVPLLVFALVIKIAEGLEFWKKEN